MRERGKVHTLFGLFAALGLLGCGTEDLDSKPDVKIQQGTSWSVTDTEVRFSPKTCVRGSAQIGWGLGSSYIEVLGRKDEFCIVDYTKEVEGSWSRYRIKIPTTNNEAYIRYQPSIDFGTHTEPGILTSFEINEADLIERDNFHSESSDEDSQRPISWTGRSIPDTNEALQFHDYHMGRGEEAKHDSKVKVNWALFCGNDFREPLIGIGNLDPISFKLGERTYGATLDSAVQGMTVGGVRYVYVRAELCQALTKKIGGFRKDSILKVELTLLSLENSSENSNRAIH